MGSKFQLNEGEVKRILNLHKKAILKENNYQILNEQQTFSLKINTDFDPSSSNNFKYDLRLYKGTTFKPSTKIKNSLVTTNQVRVDYVYGIFNSIAGASGLNNKAFVVYNCKTKRMYTVQNTKLEEFDYKETKWTYDAKNMVSLDDLCTKIPDPTLKDEFGLKTDKCKIKKPKVDGNTATTVISYYYDGKSKCEKGQGTKGFSSIEDCTKKCVTKKKEEDDKDNYRKILPVIDDEDEIVRGGESDDDDKRLGCENRHKTIECRSSQKKCNTQAIRLQALINCKCPSNILDALLRGFPKARTGNSGDYTLREDGIWGDGSVAAWETCEDLIRRGSSNNDDKDDQDNKDKDKNVSDDQQVKDNKGLDNNLPKEKDLKLTPEEFAKLIQ